MNELTNQTAKKVFTYLTIQRSKLSENDQIENISIIAGLNEQLLSNINRGENIELINK